jgi:hypothetical protein
MLFLLFNDICTFLWMPTHPAAAKDGNKSTIYVSPVVVEVFKIDPGIAFITSKIDLSLLHLHLAQRFGSKIRCPVREAPLLAPG